MAKEVFKDPLAPEWLEGHEDGEERFNILGTVNNRLLFVAYTPRKWHHAHHLRTTGNAP